MKLNLMLACLAVSFAACQGDSPGTSAGSASATGEAVDTGSAQSGSVTESGSGTSGVRYHPADFAMPGAHGLAAKLNTDNCQMCHGEDLQGGIAPDCDSCHKEGWRTDCVYCHGGDDTPTGAPPREIDGSSLLEDSTFRVHTSHVTETNHPAFACSMCHVQPDNVLSPGHMFDETPAYAEVDFSGGLSPDGLWAAGTCGNLYCHGNGNGLTGPSDHADPTPTCSGCHADETTALGWLGMSGEHGKHLLEGFACADCHANVTDAAGVISNASMHVNGVADVQMLDPAVTYDAAAVTCTGLCHGENHVSVGW